MLFSRRFGLPEDGYTLKEYTGGAPDEAEISDPYGYTKLAYRASVRQLFEYVERVLDRLERESAEKSS